MSLLAGKHFRHIESEGIVQVVDTAFGTNLETGETTMVVKVACECGREHYFEVESFMLEFELVEEVQTVTFVAPWMDEDFWTAVYELAEEFDLEVNPDEYDDGSGPMMAAVEEAEYLEGGEDDNVERLH